MFFRTSFLVPRVGEVNEHIVNFVRAEHIAQKPGVVPHDPRVQGLGAQSSANGLNERFVLKFKADQPSARFGSAPRRKKLANAGADLHIEGKVPTLLKSQIPPTTLKGQAPLFVKGELRVTVQKGGDVLCGTPDRARAGNLGLVTT
jgi:hypothetical protein